MKLLNTARDMNNFSVVIHTLDLSCHHKDLYIYGHSFNKFDLTEAEIINGFNRCVFKAVANGFSPYVFVSVKQIPENETWRICELEFA